MTLKNLPVDVSESELYMATGANVRSSSARILFLNRSYWPDVEATGQLLTSLCEGLTSDFRIEVLAGQPNSVIGNMAAKDWKSISCQNKVQIHRIPHSTLPKRNIAFKAVNFLSFVRAADAALHRIPTPDVVVFETDPFLLAFAADRLRKRTGCQMVGYLQDIYPDVAVALGKVRNSWAIRRLRQSLFQVYQRCDQMVVLSRDMADLLAKGGVSREKITIVPNWATIEGDLPERRVNPFRIQHGLDGRFVVMYSGNLGLTQRLEDFVSAAEQLINRPDIVFTFVGRGSQEQSLRRMVAEKSLTNVRFFDYQPQEDLAISLTAADLHLVPLTSQISQCLMPSKLYGILAAGRPYLTNAPEDTELHEMTVRHQVGLTVQAGSPTAVAAKIQWAADHPEDLCLMGQNARRLAETTYTKTNSIEHFRNMLSSVIGTP